MSEEAIGYEATHIEVMEGREAIRKRPGMYVGSTGIRGLHQLVFGVVGRAVNEVLTGGGGCVDVVLTPDGGVRVTDDGPGVPFEAAGDVGYAGGVGLEAMLTRLDAGAGPVGRHTVTMGVFDMGPLSPTLCRAASRPRYGVGMRVGSRSTREVSPSPRPPPWGR
ncbi:hypothetical protein ACFVT5_09750 [Streptomyces sp. NPDC058001]|uniref:hypothetical protein n=1 Tax=Streptomyces sp. NPDC058001 TaxID=3346300 RepID=UPI0036E30F62